MTDTHHPFSPSKLDRYKHCPGAYAASMRVQASMTPEEWEEFTGSDAAREGTMLHAVMSGNIPLEGLTPEHDELIAQCGEYLEMHFGDCDEIMREHKVVLMDGMEILTSGTADVISIGSNILKLLDWKFGRVYVHPDSLQMKAYAAATMQTFDVDAIQGYIFQPRSGGGKEIMFTNFQELFDEIKGIIDAAKSQYAPLIPGEHCQYCPARIDCTAIANLETAISVKPESLLANSEKLGQAAEIAQVVKKRCDMVLAACKKATIEGKETGWKITERTGKPTIVDPQKAFDSLKDLIPFEEFTSIVTVPYGKLRDKVALADISATGRTRKESEEWLIGVLCDSMSRGKPSQVMSKDKKKN